MTNDNEKLLIQGALAFGIALNAAQIEQFKKYHEALMEWNEKVNLTAITEEREVVMKHFVDSLSVMPYIPEQAKTIVDVGTGAGFPGIPIKIACQEKTVTLIDSLEKRIRFLNYVIEQNALTKIQTFHGRAEDLARSGEHREAYDVGIARAVASLSVLCEYILPYIKVGGTFIAMKGSDVNKELEEAERAVSILGGRIKEVHQFTLPGEMIHRSIILIQKIIQAPTTYPRKSGIPTKSPL